MYFFIQTPTHLYANNQIIQRTTRVGQGTSETRTIQVFSFAELSGKIAPISCPDLELTLSTLDPELSKFMCAMCSDDELHAKCLVRTAASSEYRRDVFFTFRPEVIEGFVHFMIVHVIFHFMIFLSNSVCEAHERM